MGTARTRKMFGAESLRVSRGGVFDLHTVLLLFGVIKYSFSLLCSVCRVGREAVGEEACAIREALRHAVADQSNLPSGRA